MSVRPASATQLTTSQEEAPLARKGGAFNFAKRAKEMKRKKKREEKLERKRARAAESPEDAPTGPDIPIVDAASLTEHEDFDDQEPRGAAGDE